MFEDISQLTAGGVLALLVIREVFSFLKARKNGNGKSRPLTGNPFRVDLGSVEAKLDKLAAAIDGLLEAQARTNRCLDDLAHSGDKTRQAISELHESIRYLEKAERKRSD